MATTEKTTKTTITWPWYLIARVGGSAATPILIGIAP